MFITNKKIIGPAIFGIVGLILLLFFYWLGRIHLLNKDLQTNSNNLNNFLTSQTESTASDKFTGNLTEGLLQEISSQVTPTVTPEGISAALPSTSFIDNISAKVVNSFSLSDFKPSIPVSSLKVLSNNSLESISSYFKSFRHILSTTPTVAISSDPSISETFAIVIKQYQSVIDSLYALPVPSSVVIYHQEEIALLKAKQNILLKTINYEDDPLATILAIQADTIIDRQLAELEVAINTFLTNQQISLN